MTKDYNLVADSIHMGGKVLQDCRYMFGISWPRITPGYLICGAVGHVVERTLTATVDDEYMLLLHEEQHDSLEGLARSMAAAVNRFAPGPLFHEGGHIGHTFARRTHALIDDLGCKLPMSTLSLLRAPYSDSPAYTLGVMREWLKPKRVMISGTCPILIEQLGQVQAADPAEIEKKLGGQWYAVAAMAFMASGAGMVSDDYGREIQQPRLGLSYSHAKRSKFSGVYM